MNRLFTRCRVRFILGALAVCAAAVDVAAQVPPSITSPPVSQSVDYGANATFTVTASGTATLFYEWRKDNVSIGVTTSTLTLNSVQSIDAGSYSVRVSNGFGAVTSSSAVLTVQTIAVSASPTPMVGGSTTLSVNAVPAQTYQWRYRGVSLPGATNATLPLSNLSRGQNGGYDVVLTYPTGTKVAHTYSLDVRPVKIPDLYLADVDFAPRFETEGAGAIVAALRLSDGKILVGGDFTRLGAVSCTYLARLNADGSVDVAFAPPVVTGPVRAIAAAPDGKIYLGGEFAIVDAQVTGSVVRLNADFTVDSAFRAAHGFDTVLALAIQPDGRLLVGGSASSSDSEYSKHLVRLEANGSLEASLAYWSTLGPVRAISLQPDGKVLIAGGAFATVSEGAHGFVTALLPGGGIDPEWAKGQSGLRTFPAPICAMLRLPDGAWVIGGGSTQAGSGILQRLSPLGADDSSFGFDSTLRASASRIEYLESTVGGRLLVSGVGLPLSRLGLNGGLDTTFPMLPFATGRVFAATGEPDGAQRLWGAFSTSVGAPAQAGSITLAATGGSFSAVNLHAVRTVAPIFEVEHVAGNKVLVRGGFTHVNDFARAGLVRLAGDGTVDPTFNAGVAISLGSTGRLAVRGDGAILVHNGNALVRLDANGAVDPMFAPLTYFAGDLVLDHDGTVLVSNGYAGGGSGATSSLRRVSTTGAVDPTFNVSVTGTFYDLVLQASGRILLGGRYGTLNGLSVNGLIRLFPNGSVDPSYQVGYLGDYRLQATANDRVYVINPVSGRGGLSRFISTGYGVGFSYEDSVYGMDLPAVAALLPLPDGGFLRASAPNSAQVGNPVWLLARHVENGSLDRTFQVDGLDRRKSRIQRMLLLDDGSVWLFGSQLSAFGAPRFGVVRIAAAAAVAITLSPSTTQAVLGGSATWTVEATGTGPLTYQWYRNGMKLPGATTSALTVSNLTVADVSLYTVTVTNAYGTVTPPAATLTGPNSAPVITTQPVSKLTTTGNPATFAVVATASGSLAYQWRRSGYNVPGATAATFTLPHPTRADAGLYDVVVSDGLSVTISRASRLDVAPALFPNALQVDPTFAPRFEAAGGTINATVLAPGGGYYVSGDFSRIGGVERPGLARIDAAFQVDPNFLPPANFADVNPTSPTIGVVRVHAVLPDGRILATRALPAFGAYPFRNTLVRLLANGAVDPTFSASTEPDSIASLAVQPDGRIIVIGLWISEPLPAGKRYVYRLLPNGALDTAYNPIFGTVSAPIAPSSVVAQADGSAIFTVGATTVNGTAVNGLIRLTATGALDPTFSGSSSSGSGSGSSNTGQVYIPNTETAVGVQTMALAPGGQWYVAGSFTRVNGVSRNQLARLNADGSTDPAFAVGAGFDTQPYSLLVLPDGKLMVGGSFYSYQGVPVAGLVRLFPNGTLDPSFAVKAPVGGLAPYGPMHLSRDGRVVIGGFACYRSDGSLDETYQPSMPGLLAAVPSTDGGEVVMSKPSTGGSFITKLRADRTIERTVSVGLNNLISLALQLDGSVLVGGSLSTPLPVVKRLTPSLGADNSFVAGPFLPPFTNSNYRGPQLLVQENGGILMNDYYGIRRLLPNGAIDASFTLPVIEVLVPQATREVLGMGLLDDGTIMLADQSLNVAGLRRTGLVRFVDSAAPVLTAQPRNRAADVGDAVTFTVTASVTGSVAYQWLKDGAAIANATTATFTLPAVGLADAGSYAVNVTGVSGTVRSKGAILTVESVAAPAIQLQPRSKSVSVGQNAVLLVVASGLPEPTYQWRKNDVPIGGATQASFIIGSARADDAGDYSVVVNNRLGSAVSLAAHLTVLPSGFTASHALVGPPFAPGGTLTVSNTLQYVGLAPALTWEVLLPAGWSFASSAGDDGATKPEVGATGLARWNWTAAPPGPVNFTYVLNCPGTVVGAQEFVALVTLRGSTPLQVLASPDPLVIRRYHSADTDHDGRISLLELTRVIELYFTRLGSVRTGSYRLDRGSEDGFAPEPLRAADSTDPLGAYHSVDANRDGRVDLVELTRMIQIYNYRIGSLRTGQYSDRADTVDGFAPGP